jgi:hypothetical protein
MPCERRGDEDRAHRDRSAHHARVRRARRDPHRVLARYQTPRVVGDDLEVAADREREQVPIAITAPLGVIVQERHRECPHADGTVGTAVARFRHRLAF